MFKYEVTSKKASDEIQLTVDNAIAQVNLANLSKQETIESAYLLVRKKLDRLEKRYMHLSMGISDTEVCEAVMEELGEELDIPNVSLIWSYPNDLSKVKSFGLAIIP